ncbi:MAG: M67 family metallopeptidase [Candidatus Thorarchaeota archaeon]|nr:MAG: M67 family metallopeptidase [Candidatus Thorarchaeota archaeon]
MPLTLQILKEDLAQLHDLAEAQLPLESAALLFGTVKDEIVSVTHVETVDNLSERTAVSFSVDPEHQYRLLIEAEERGEELVAIFHSHPAPPRPSSRDLENMKLNPVVWLIASKTTGQWETRAFIVEGATYEEVLLKAGQDAV